MNTNEVPEVKACAPILVYGATLTGVGIAAASPGEVLVVEPSALVGSEFIASFNPGENWEQTPVSTAAKQLRQELIRRNLLSTEGRVHLPPVAPVLFNLIRTEQLPVQMMTKIAAVESSASGYLVTLYNASGLKQIEVGSLIDTTSTCASSPAYNVEIQYRKLNAMLHSPYPELPEVKAETQDELIELVPGLLPGELILKLNLERDDGWIEARSKMHRYSMNRPAPLRDCVLAAVADTFEIGVAKGPHELASGWQWLPSCAYSNLLEAFDAGQLFVGGELHEAIAAL